MLHITFSKYDCIIVHKAYYLFTCTCVSINSFHSHSHSHMPPLSHRCGNPIVSAVTCVVLSYDLQTYFRLSKTYTSLISESNCRYKMQ